ncbi:MAG: TorF family putative porin [Pseudomonadota bacterium]|jgi:uncharacterized protein (TIGR02001 family)
MNTKIVALAVAGALSSPLIAVAADPAPEHTFTGNVTLASEYLYRGIAQTRGKPAIQGGFDYAHKSGLYAGLWASSITWIGDASASASAGIEVDVYGGYKGTIVDDLGFDVGVLTYNYPGTGKPTGNAKPDTTEIYGALSYKWLTLKYSHSTGSLFGWTKPNGDKTSGSGYLELNAAYDLGDGWGINGHVGHQKVKGLSDASYTDYKVGVTKDVGFGVFGLAYSTTNAKDSCTGNAAASASDVYCFVKSDSSSAYEAGKGRLLLTFGKTF